DATGYAHSQGVIHRDLKPANIMIGPFGETMVIDWGLAKLQNGALAEPTAASAAAIATSPEPVTHAGRVIGTPTYMAPEQARGEPVDARADVYALGVILYHLLAGRPPSGANGKDKAAREKPVPLVELEPRVPSDLIAIVEKAMSCDPGGRYESAKALADDLRRFQTGQLVGAHAYSLGTLIWRWVRRHRVVVAVAGVMMLALVASESISWRRILHEHAAVLESRNALLLAQASAELDRDPTATVAWLKLYPASGAAHRRISEVAAEALSRGVARHIFRTTGLRQEVDFSSDGKLMAGFTAPQTAA